MEYLGFVFGIFGFIAYLSVSSLKGRVSELERQLRSIRGTGFAQEKQSLLAAARGYLGKDVALRFREDEEDPDVLMAAMKMGRCTLLDADEDWLLVHVEHHGAALDRLIRLDTVAALSAAPASADAT